MNRQERYRKRKIAAGMSQVTVFLPTEFVNEIRAAARHQGITLSDLVARLAHQGASLAPDEPIPSWPCARRVEMLKRLGIRER